jgi:hypothetical protein
MDLALTEGAPISRRSNAARGFPTSTELGVPHAIRFLFGFDRMGLSLVGSSGNTTVVQRLSQWVHRYVTQLRLGAGVDLADDAFQHLLLVLVEMGDRAPLDKEYITLWCKRVVRNFVISELRRVRKLAPYQTCPNEVTEPVEMCVETRDRVNILVNNLRQQVARDSSTGRKTSRLRLFDAWVEHRLGFKPRARHLDETARNRMEQYRCRGHRVACSAYEHLRCQQGNFDDMTDIAEQLGLIRSKVGE